MAKFLSLAQSVDRFEAAWRLGVPPRIADFLPSADESDAGERLATLCELVCIDLEYRWRRDGRRRGALPWLLEDYVREVLDLSSFSGIPLLLIAEEFRVRHRFGDRPHIESYRSRWPERWPELEPLLGQVLKELKEEYLAVGLSQVPSHAGTIAVDAPIPYQDFVVEQMLGSGQMGKVYRAWQRSLERHVALKFLRKSFLSDADAIERFVREARIVAQLRHPNILAVHGLGRTPAGGYFMVLDFVQGHDLAKHLREQPVSIEQAIHWISAAAGALAHAHRRGIIHCDLKPANLLQGDEGRLVVADFGLARDLRHSPPREVAGTAPFMAPEQIEPSFGSIGPWTDVYGLAAVLYALLAGHPPYTGRTAADVLAQIVAGSSVPAISKYRTDVSGELADLCLRCLQRDSAVRFQDMDQFRTALAAFA